MKLHAAHNRRSRGVAIIVVLALVVLLTTIVVAFFSRAILDRQISNSSTDSGKAEVLAHGALDEILLDLKQEIAAGSRIDQPPTGATGNGKATLFIPKPSTANASSTITPALVPPANPPVPAVIVKRSSFGQPFYQGANYDVSTYPPSNAASAVNSSANPAMDGRFISGERWNKPLLLNAASLGGSANLSAAVYNGYFAAPDWVLVSRGGPKAFSSWDASINQGRDPTNLNYVLGRYAYVVYDEGGLLDANHAGFPKSLVSDADFTARRGRLAQVDLSQIPGVLNVDPIIFAFRNAKTASDNASYRKYVLNDNPTNPGFLHVVPGDQTFLSRQDLINFQQQNPAALGTAALQYLGTFSRAINAPSWTPPANATDLPAPVAPTNGPGNIFAYKTNAENGAATTKNRDVATVRFANSGVIAATPLLPLRTVAAGEPVLKRRFSLTRLSWIGRDGPANGANDADVKRAFGLRWVSQGVWQYTSPDGTGLANSIKTLNAVAALATPREPDFFELLQAGILSGSLALSSSDRDFCDTQREDKSAFRQIIQIGANIIDQYDTDSFPTTIQFDLSGDSPSVDSRLPDNFNVVGVEDLPYISQVGGILHRDDNGNSITREQVYMPVEMWNPNQTSSAVYNGPKQLRIMVRNGTSIYKKYGAYPPYSEVPRDFKANPAEIDFPLPSQGGIQSMFREPGMLTSANSKSSETNNIAPTSFGPWMTIPGAAGKPFSSPLTQNELAYFGALTGSPNDPAPTFELQYQNADGSWITYQVLPATVPANYSQSPTYLWPSDNQNAWVTSGIRADPRGMRLGMSEAGTYTNRPPFVHEANLSSATDPTGNNGDESASYFGKPRSAAGGVGPIFYPSANTPFTADANFGPSQYYTPMFAHNRGDPPSIDPNSTCYYTDVDQVVRWGDADRSSGIKPMMPNHTQDRPIFLNRAFRTVGELGYVYRDVPWKTLDFNTVKSADAALLDLFTVDDADVVAGRVNLNTRQSVVLQALLTGAAKTEMDPPSGLSADDASKIVQTLTATTGAQPPFTSYNQGPMVNLAELVTRPSGTGNAKNWIGDATNGNTTIIKTQREAAVRILAGATDTRTWNLLIDLVAQSGRYTPNASSLSQFTVAGERRYWLHVAIDRYTGQIVDQQLETVNE